MLGTMETIAKREWFIETLIDRDVFAAVSQHLAHPDQFAEKLIDALDVRRFVQNLSTFTKQLLRPGEIPIPEDCHQAKLPQYRQKVFDYSHATKAARRNSADADRLMDVLFKI